MATTKASTTGKRAAAAKKIRAVAGKVKAAAKKAATGRRAAKVRAAAVKVKVAAKKAATGRQAAKVRAAGAKVKAAAKRTVAKTKKAARSVKRKVLAKKRPTVTIPVRPAAQPRGRTATRTGQIAAQESTPAQQRGRASFDARNAPEGDDLGGVATVRNSEFKEEDQFTNKSGDPRIGTHGRTYKP